MSALVVIAKECLPGRVKTRLHPPLTLEAAAGVAAAALADTLAAASAVPAERRIVFFDGTTPPPGSRDFEILPQPGGTLDERLAWLFDHLDEPTLLIGMDTPQLRAEQLRFPSTTDVVYGPALDGGFWALGMREPRGDVIRGVPMSRPDTGALQLAALARCGLRVELLDALRDVDEIADAEHVAAITPGSRFADELARAARSVAA